MTGLSEPEHLETIEGALRRSEQAGLHLRRYKYVFLVSYMVYLGYKIGSLGLHPILDMVRAMQEAPHPWSVHQLFISGVIDTSHKFLPNLSSVLKAPQTK